MIDVHSHILPEIDDGSRSMEETIEMIKQAKDAGFDTIISTSHYMENYYEADVRQRTNLIARVKRKLKEQNIEINIYPGSEIYISENLATLLKQKEASCLRNSQYVLFEFPLNAKPANMKDLIYGIQKIKKIPVLAHPERYSFIQEDPSLLYELIQMGVLMQSNYSSFVGRYGSKAKFLAKKMLKCNMTHFLGSDCHRKNTTYKEVPEVIKIVDSIAGKEKRIELTQTNPMHIVKKEKFEIEEPEELKVTTSEKIVEKMKKLFK